MMMGAIHEENDHLDKDKNKIKVKTDRLRSLSTRDMDGREVTLEPGDPLHVNSTGEQANAIYIGGGMGVCVRGNRVVKERLWNTRFRKSNANVSIGECERQRAVGRAIETIGRLFTDETGFVNWCYTDA